jgi:hypothetical protein
MKKELKFEKMWEAANTYEMSNMNQAKLVGNKNFTDSKFLEDYFSGIDNVLEQQTDLFKKIEKTDFDKLDNKEIKNILTKSVNLIVENFGYYLACQPQYVSKLEEEIQNELKDFIPESKISDVFSLLSTPTENTKIRQEEIDWLDLLINSKKENVSLEDEIKKHHSKYFLLNAADGQEPFSVDYYIKKFEEDSKNTLGSLEEKKEEIYLGIDEIKNNKKTVINKYLIDQGLVEKCKILSKVGHARLEMRIVGWMPGYYYNQFIINEISKRFDYSSKELRFLTVVEIYNL